MRLSAIVPWLLSAACVLGEVSAVHAQTKPAKPLTPAAPVAAKAPDSPKVAPSKHAQDEAVIRKSVTSYQEAYAKGDVAAVAGHYTEDAEYMDEGGNVTQGRAALSRELVEHFRQMPGAKLETEIESIRFIAPGVAIEDGITRHTHEGDPQPVVNRYTAVHAKVEGKWLLASVRDFPAAEFVSVADRLKELEWLLGDWIDEEEESITKFSCRRSDNGNYLLREFTITMEGQKVLTGTQRITWDPRLGQFRSWSFDSDGGFAEGLWHFDGTHWIVKSNGQTAAGESAAMTNAYTVVNDHTLEFQTVDFLINGETLPATPVVNLVRAPRAPGAKNE